MVEGWECFFESAGGYTRNYQSMHTIVSEERDDGVVDHGDEVDGVSKEA